MAPSVERASNTTVETIGSGACFVQPRPGQHNAVVSSASPVLALWELLVEGAQQRRDELAASGRARAIRGGKKVCQPDAQKRFQFADFEHLRTGFISNFLEVLVKNKQINALLKNSLTSHFNRID
jgi:hypothetical protein